MLRRKPSPPDLKPRMHRSDLRHDPQLGPDIQTRHLSIRLDSPMCNVIARFPPHYFLRVFLPIASPATLHYSKYLAVNLKKTPGSHRKVRGYASRFNQDMKIPLGPSWMHDVCDGRVARRRQLDTASHSTCSCFMAHKCQLLTRKRASVVLQKLHAKWELPIHRTDISTCLIPPVLPLALVSPSVKNWVNDPAQVCARFATGLPL